MVQFNLKIGCVHTDLEKNVECNLIDYDNDYLTYQCPQCKKEIIIIYSVNVKRDEIKEELEK